MCKTREKSVKLGFCSQYCCWMHFNLGTGVFVSGLMLIYCCLLLWWCCIIIIITIIIYVLLRSFVRWWQNAVLLVIGELWVVNIWKELLFKILCSRLLKFYLLLLLFTAGLGQRDKYNNISCYVFGCLLLLFYVKCFFIPSGKLLLCKFYFLTIIVMSIHETPLWIIKENLSSKYIVRVSCCFSTGVRSNHRHF